MKAVCLITLSGCPSLGVPAGFARNNAMGIQIIAPIGHDLDCLKLGQAYERATNWTGKRRLGLLNV